MKKALSLLLALALLIGMMPQFAISAGAEEVPMYLEVTPEDYLTISRDSTEKLACGPCMVSFGNGNVAVAYLADDVNTVETESSTTIVCRLGLFNLANPEQGSFFDIATAGQTIGDVIIGSKAPYEPNLLALDDDTLLVLFNIRDTSGNYTYYSANFDTKTNTVISYQPLMLNGKNWTPGNIAAAYNAIGTNSISATGPTSSMVFTSQILRYGGYFYGYCGGVCNRFSGMLVRSTDGIHWETVMAPEAVSEMKGVIECGFQIVDDMIYFCMRDISSGVYHCSYRFSTQEQLKKLQKLSNLTTSKPTTFIQDNQLYLIVNKATGDDNTVGRRNTALIYRVNPENCKLTQVKQIFCADGCAYHTVGKFSGTNYWCFHTDARRINPYTQGRSNLAFMEIPSFPEPSTPENGSLFDFANYITDRAKGCVTLSTNTWQSGAVNYHYQIPLSDFTDCDAVTITANPNQKAYIAFFAEKMVRDGTVVYAEGWNSTLVMEPGTTQRLTIPADAQYLYILETNAAGNSLLPSQVEFHMAHVHSYTPDTTAPTCTEQGYTTYTCACGESYMDDYVDAAGHTFADGVCDTCGALDAHVEFYSLSLKGNIAVNYYMYIDQAIAADPDGYMEFTTPRGGAVQIPVSQANVQTVDGQKYYVFTATVAAKEMMDTIQGQYICGESKSEIFYYSVKEYAEIILNDEAYAKVQPLVEAMLVYGAWAQKQFNYNEDNLPIEVSDLSQITADTLSKFKPLENQGTAAVSFYATSLILESETTMRLYFQCTKEPTITFRDKQLEVTKIDGGYCYVDIPNISAKNLSDTFTLTVSDGAETTNVQCCPLSYCYNILSKETDSDLLNTVRALYLYNEAANNYFK